MAEGRSNQGIGAQALPQPEDGRDAHPRASSASSGSTTPPTTTAACSPCLAFLGSGTRGDRPLARWQPPATGPTTQGCSRSPALRTPRIRPSSVARTWRSFGAPVDDLVFDRPGARFGRARSAQRAVRWGLTSRRASTRSASCGSSTSATPPGISADPGGEPCGDRPHRRRGRGHGSNPSHARRRSLDHGTGDRGARRATRPGRAHPLRHAHGARHRGVRGRALSRDADVPAR